MSNFPSIPNSLLPPAETLDTGSVSSSTASEQFLRLHLVPETTALLPMRQLTEVLSIPIGQIVPIPHMPAWTIGVYNWRGEILWMLDLGHLIGLTPWYQQGSGTSNHSVVVLNAHNPNTNSTNSKSQMLGLVVNRVEDLEWCDRDLIQSPLSSNVNAELVPFLRGYWLKPNGEMLVVLDGEAIIAAMANW
ncbi:MAG TPA: chemotaxis protein CheW [Cyanobacteria bacterium UBA8803]|nr:chemotaxis protein CheW [Cyanobacteria bacterium UBA9273]HBL60330.1 chemotaxis protein CheW [Cyanobacteria bacterium UBA8803]